jgi:hypothetical protein
MIDVSDVLMMCRLCLELLVGSGGIVEDFQFTWGRNSASVDQAEDSKLSLVFGRR